MIERYLKSSGQLKLVFLLLDIRHEPNENDKQMYEWIRAQGMQPVIIATKMDKVSRAQVIRQTSMILKSLKSPAGTKIIPFSALSKQGVEEIWTVIEELLPSHEL